MTRVAIVDDHSVVRIGMRYVLMTDEEFEFVGEADDGAAAVDLVERVKPDILLLDVRMPGVDGLSALERIREKFPGLKVVMLTMSDVEEDIFKALSLGACGYVIKDNSPRSMIASLKKVIAGEMCVSDEIRRVYESRRAERGLTDREKEVLVLASKGCSNQEIGAMTHLSANTVKHHLQNVFDTLGASDRAEAVALAIRRGVIK